MDINTKEPALATTTEIVNAMMFSDVDAATAQRVTTEGVDFHGALKSQLDIDLSDDVNVDFVANSGNEVNLILPYYESLDDARAKIIGDEELEEVGGGEFIVIGIILGVSGTVLLTGGIIGAVVGIGLAGAEIARGTGGYSEFPEGYSGAGYHDLASAAKTGNQLLGI